jgi:small subunit ribosomal protein S20
MHFKSTAKTVADKVLASIEANDVEGAKKLLIEASSVLDKVASKGIIHKNKAARKKSRLSLKVKMLTASSSSSSQPASS